MKLLDLNLLVYAVDEASPRHRAAAPWVEATIRGPETVALPWLVLLGFLRLTTRAAVMTSPLTVGAAMDVVDGWLSRRNVVVPQPGDRHAALLRELLAPLGGAGNLTSGAHLAALAIEYGATLCSSDADFSRFAGLRWEDPLRS